MKSKAILICIVFVVLFVAAFAMALVTFERTYGGSGVDWGRAVIQNDDGDYLVAGYTDSYGTGGDICFLKLDSYGDTVWQNYCGGNQVEMSYAICPASDGGYVITGTTESYGNGGIDVYIQKIDSLGNPLWHREYGGSGSDYGLAVSPTQDGGYIIAGHTTSFGAVGSDGYLIKVDSMGDSVWAYTYYYSNSQYNDEFYSGTSTSDGGFIAAGMYMSWPPRAYIVKTDSLGNVEWDNVYFNYNWGRANCIIETSPDGYAATGVWGVLGDTAFIALVRLDGNGDITSYDTSGVQIQQSGYSLAQLSDGGFVVAGYAMNGFYFDAVLLRTDSSGDQLWTRYFGGDQAEIAYSVIPTSDDGFILTGYTESYGPGSEAVYVVKTDSLGVVEPTSAEENSLIPDAIGLSQNYPNPFNAQTTIGFSLPEAQNIQLTIYDLLGRKVRILLDEYHQQGSYTIDFDASGLSSGVYFYRLSAGGTVETKRMLLLK